VDTRAAATDEEALRLADRHEIKKQRLAILDKQADLYGERDVPPQIEMERVQLRYELKIIETALNTPARSTLGDELGPAARFMVNVEQNRQIEQKIALLGKRLEDFIGESKSWRDMNRQVLLIVGIVVIIILVAVAVLTTYVLTRGAV